ncbi:MAG: CoA transferase [Xanthobacteraceae bacterium]|jgi:crotonobetainyl-CoA:carnitine CoA-transferase CaiB-like acyl-CoA transferase
MAGPLSGIRVLDLTSVVAGPLATQTLGDMGADVIKIESPDGDTTRYTGPARSADMAALFMGLNRGKRSLVLDLKQESAKAALWRLVAAADVFVHSMRPQKIERLGFAHEAVCARNPRIVYAGLHGYRSGGPYSGQPAYDDVIQGQSGVASLMAEVAGAPRYAPTILADKTTALTLVGAVTAALFARERTGSGQFVEVPMFETMVSFVLAEHLFGHCFTPPVGQLGYTRVLGTWRRPYQTKDGFLCMMAYTEAQWRKFWTMVGRPEICDDPRFCSIAARSHNVVALYELAGACLADKTTDEWLALLRKLEIPAARVSSLDEVIADPQLAATGFVRHATHPSEGNIRFTDLPVRFGDAGTASERLQPRLGEHSVEVLREAGLNVSEIRALIASGATVETVPEARAAE